MAYVRHNLFGTHALMIRLDNVGKQNGHQIVFIEASTAVQKGEKIGLSVPTGRARPRCFGWSPARNNLTRARLRSIAV